MNSTLAVTADAEETKLTTLERVKLELEISGSDSDELLKAKIDDASSDIVARCAPSLRRETVTETFYPDEGWVCVEKLGLRRWPVSSITSVTLDGALVDPAEYRFDGEVGQLYRVSTGGYPSRWSFCKSLVAVYAGGYLLPGQEGRNLPPSLEAAAIELVASYWASRGRDPAVMEEENMGVARFRYWVGAIGQSGDLPPGVMAKLGPFARVGFS